MVALALFAQIVLSLWDLFNRAGKVFVVLLFAAGAAAGYLTWIKVIDPYLRTENPPAAKVEP